MLRVLQVRKYLVVGYFERKRIQKPNQPRTRLRDSRCLMESEASVRYLLAIVCAVVLSIASSSIAQAGLPAQQRAPDRPTYPPQPPPLKRGEAVRVGGNVPEPRQTKHVDPAYPKSAGDLDGVVIVEFLIGTKGRVSDVKVVRSFQPFDKAVIAAVKQWRYEPTRFRGTTVPILMTVGVAFKDGKTVTRLIR